MTADVKPVFKGCRVFRRMTPCLAAYMRLKTLLSRSGMMAAPHTGC